MSVSSLTAIVVRRYTSYTLARAASVHRALREAVRREIRRGSQIRYMQRICALDAGGCVTQQTYAPTGPAPAELSHERVSVLAGV